MRLAFLLEEPIPVFPGINLYYYWLIKKGFFRSRKDRPLCSPQISRQFSRQIRRHLAERGVS